jgi:1-acyl-sn-glycerol-3-phosphate acyltransferase
MKIEEYLVFSLNLPILHEVKLLLLNTMKFKFTHKNVFFVLYVTWLAILTPFILLPAIFIRLFGSKKKSDNYVNAVAQMYARHMFWVFRIKVIVSGLEHLPESNNVCFVSNHQGLADIPLIVGYIPKTVGFIAKKELGKIPFLNIWMSAMGCVLIDRSNARNSLSTIEKGIKQLQKGHPMVIFPEGTRSKGETMRPFKPGSFKLITGAQCLAVPLTISGSYKVMETKGEISGATINLTIHPAIDVAKLSKEETDTLYQITWKTINPTL